MPPLMKTEIDKLYASVRKASPNNPRTRETAQLLASDRTKIAKKVVEEAAEVSLACVADNRKEVVQETADLFYNLVVLLAAMDLKPADIWKEMASRKAAFGLAVKRPKSHRSQTNAGGGGATAGGAKRRRDGSAALVSKTPR